MKNAHLLCPIKMLRLLPLPGQTSAMCVWVDAATSQNHKQPSNGHKMRSTLKVSSWAFCVCVLQSIIVTHYLFKAYNWTRLKLVYLHEIETGWTKGNQQIVLSERAYWTFQLGHITSINSYSLAQYIISDLYLNKIVWAFLNGSLFCYSWQDHLVLWCIKPWRRFAPLCWKSRRNSIPLIVRPGMETVVILMLRLLEVRNCDYYLQ